MGKSKKDQRRENARQESAEPAKKSTFAYGLALLSACVVFALITLGAFGGAGAVVTDFLLGVFGYVFYAYIVIGICYGVILMLGKKPTVSRGVRFLYALSLAAIVAMIHMFSSRGYASAGWGEYISACYNGADTAAGVFGAILLYFPTRIYVASQILIALVLVGLIALLIVSQVDREFSFKLRKTRTRAVARTELPAEEEHDDGERSPMYNGTVDGKELSDRVSRTFGSRATEYTPIERMDAREEERPAELGEGDPISDSVVENALNVYRTRREQAMGELYSSRPEPKPVPEEDLTPEERTRRAMEALYGENNDPVRIDRRTNDAQDDIYRSYSRTERMRIMRENQRRMREEAGIESGSDGDDVINAFNELLNAPVSEQSNADETEDARDDGGVTQLPTSDYTADNSAEEAPQNDGDKEDVEDLSSRNPEPLESFVDFLNRDKEENPEPPAPPQPPVVRPTPIVPRVIKPAPPQPKSEPKPQPAPEPKPEPKPIKRPPYKPPQIADLRDYNENVDGGLDYDEKKESVERCLENFNIPAKVVNIVKGPTFSRLELDVPPGISVNKIPAHYNDLAMALAVESLRIEAPIPKKRFCGIEIPNERRGTVSLKSVIDSPEFNVTKKKGLYFALGKDIDGNCYVSDLTSFPHALVAGGTGSGKSVCLNCMIVSLLYKYTPDQLRLILIDPKMVEFNIYKELPHLVVPEILSETSKMINALKWSIDEMNRRYEMMSRYKLAKIDDYNELADSDKTLQKLPYIVIIIDEVADIMQSKAGKEFEGLVKTLTAKSRASGIHLVLATQRPSVDVITGTIKANLPTRIAFAVTQQVDSKTILDMSGAERLLGKGDMLIKFVDKNHPVRVQGAFVNMREVAAVVDEVVANNVGIFDPEIAKVIDAVPAEEEERVQASSTGGTGGATSLEQDPAFIGALRLALENKAIGRGISVSMLQRKLSLGFPKAAKILDQMEDLGYVSGMAQGNKPRDVYITQEMFDELYGDDGGDDE